MQLTDPILVTGATGYVGGRLIPRLLERGYKVRAAGRSLDKLSCRPWAFHPFVELVESDLLDFESVKRAVAGCGAAYYLVHSMNAQKGKYAQADRRSAQNMVEAAKDSSLEQIIYLSGLGERDNEALTPHLKSRHEVEEILASGPVPATSLRAAMILGSGSASFEMLRYLTERLPVMITPKWVHTRCQPISISNIIGYLIGALESEKTRGKTFDIGGPDVLTYKDIIDIYTDEAGLSRRRIIPVPFLSPTLSAYWIHIITPVPASIAQPLAQGLSIPVICREERIKELVPQRLISCREAIRTALERVKQELVETCWSDAGEMVPPEWAFCGDEEYTGGTVLECGYRAEIRASEQEVWSAVSKIGGKTGWYHGNLLWRLRGILDIMAGGGGLRRGRRHSTEILTGDALDFWRVLKAEKPYRLLLLAEMKMPGEALLDIGITPKGPGKIELSLLSRFLPLGLAGLAYWYLLYPFHQWIFQGMLQEMARSVQKPVVRGPERFTPKIPDACSLPPINRKPKQE